MSDITDLCQIIHRGIGLNFEDLAEEIIAAGFHRDRTITTAEELDALPAGTIVMDRRGEPWLCCSYDGSCWEGLEAVMTPRALIRLSPLRVLYVPEEATR